MSEWVVSKRGQAGFLSLRLGKAVLGAFFLASIATAGDASEFTVPMISRGVSSRPIQMRFVGSNPSPIVEQILEHGGLPAGGGGSDGPRLTMPKLRHTVYRQVYNGVDLLAYTEGGRVQYDLIVTPGADPETIRIVYEGFENVELYAELPGYQMVGNEKAAVPVIMEKTPHAYYRFVIASYNPSLDLVIPTTSVPITARARSYAQGP